MATILLRRWSTWILYDDLHKEERGDMMLLMVPTLVQTVTKMMICLSKILYVVHDVGGVPPYIRIIHKTSHIQVRNDIRGYCWPSLILEVAHITSDVEKGFLEVFIWYVNNSYQRGFFRGRRYVIHEVLEFLKIFRSLLLKKNLLDGYLLCCFIFCLSFFLFYSHLPSYIVLLYQWWDISLKPNQGYTWCLYL